MKLKNEVSSLFQKFHKMIATQYQSHIQVLRTDNGGEFVNQDLKKYLQEHGISHHTTCPYSPQQNGVAERKNRHLLEVVWTFLFGAHMPTSYGGEVLSVAAYLINRVPSNSLNFQTPFKVLSFGCVAFVHLPKPLCDKLEPRALRCLCLLCLTSERLPLLSPPITKNLCHPWRFLSWKQHVLYCSRVLNSRGETK